MSSPIIVHYYSPPGVIAPCGVGGSCYVGRLADNAVLKYPLTMDEWPVVKAEGEMYRVLGLHPRILTCFGLDDHGLKLEFAANGTVKNFLQSNYISLSPKQKIIWTRQLAEAIAHIHSKNIIHCNISTANLLLDDNFDIKVSDFQGRLVDPLTGAVLANGFALESVKSYLPRVLGEDDERFAYCREIFRFTDISTRSDIFAFGTTFYEIMTGDEPYPELDSFYDEEEVTRRFKAMEFPCVDGLIGGEIIRKCWLQMYQDVDECLRELRWVEDQYTTSYTDSTN